MHVQIAEQRALPTAEAVKCHRHGDRHVHADHPDLHLVTERACGVAVTREDRGAVAEFVLIDQSECGRQIRHSHHDEYRTENLLAIDTHVRLDTIEQRRTEIEAVRLTCQL